MGSDRPKTICITGGAGFVGSNLAVLFKQHHPEWAVWAVDCLKRRGSELTLPRLRKHGVEFVHGDVRCPEDIVALPDFELLIDCSAEPSVQAGIPSAAQCAAPAGAAGSPWYLLNTNLVGTINCLEAARVRQAAFLFLSTSRVYPIAALNGLHFEEEESRFRWTAGQEVPGWSEAGIAEEFPLAGARSMYGASKLAGELLLQEYVYSYGLPGIINRCGILAGPWQMGKADQGVVALWVARHHFRKDLTYIGFGGTGKQVRDMLHIEDLFMLLQRQVQDMKKWDGRVYNVGGGLPGSASLLELTRKCQAVTGNKVSLAQEPKTSSVDVRIYLTDCRRVSADFQWHPQHDVDAMLRDIHAWIRGHEELVKPLFA